MTMIEELKNLLTPVCEAYSVADPKNPVLPTKRELLDIAHNVGMSGTPLGIILDAGKAAANKGWSTVAYVKLDADGREEGRGVGSKKAYDQAMKDGDKTVKGIAIVDPDGTVTFIK